MLDLAAVDDALREHAVLVADAVAEGGQAERGHRIQETRRQPAQAAVAQCGVGLVLLDVLEAACACAARAAAASPCRSSAASALPSVRPIRNSIDR